VKASTLVSIVECRFGNIAETKLRNCARAAKLFTINQTRNCSSDYVNNN